MKPDWQGNCNDSPTNTVMVAMGDSYLLVLSELKRFKIRGLCNGAL